MRKKFIFLLVSIGLIILTGILTSCSGGGGGIPPIAGTNVENTAELKAALEDETVEIVFLTGDAYEMSDLVLQSGKRLIGPNSPDYPASLSKRGNCVMMPEADATSGALVRIHAFSDVAQDVTISGVNFQLPEDYQWDNMHDFFMVFIEGNSTESSSTLANITVEDCIFDYTTAPDAPEGRDLSTGISINTSEVTKAENITIRNNTFKLKTSNTDNPFKAIEVFSAANDGEKGIVISNNKIYGGTTGIGHAPFGIRIESMIANTISSRQADTVHVKLNNNRFYGKDTQGNILNFYELINIARNTLNIQLDITGNEFGTVAAPIVSNDKLANVIWLGFNDSYPSGLIEFTTESTDNSFVMQNGQYKTLVDFYCPEPTPENYQVKLGAENFTTLNGISSALTTQEGYNIIVDSVDALGRYLDEDLPKNIYTLPGSYENVSLGVPFNNISVIGPLSPDYPADLTQGEAAFTPEPNMCAFNILHFLNQGDPEIAEHFQKENIRFSGLTFTVPTGVIMDELITFFDIGVYYSGGGPSEMTSRDIPDWYLKNFSIDHCNFDFSNVSPQNAGINGITYSAEFCTFEDFNISNNTFCLKRLESTYIDGEGEEQTWRMDLLNGACGSDNPDKKFKINNNVFSGSEVGSAGRLPRYLTLFPDGGAYNTKEIFYFEIKNNQFEGNKEYGRIIQTHNIKKVNIDFAGNQYGSETTPFRNDIEQNGSIVMFFLNDDNPITFNETDNKSTYYAATPNGTINFAIGASYGGAVNIHYGEQQVSEEEIKDLLCNVVN